MDNKKNFSYFIFNNLSQTFYLNVSLLQNMLFLCRIVVSPWIIVLKLKPVNLYYFLNQIFFF